jgi:transcriptional/translational regulatory protein YebC/TACO1
VQSDDETHTVTTSVEGFAAVRDALEEKFGAPDSSGLVWRPLNTIAVNEEQGAALLKLLDTLDDNDDVQRVSANFEIPDDIMARLTA